MTDPWARMISYHFLNQTSRDNFFTNDTAHGAGQLWSDVPLIPSWQQHQVPFPIIQADSRPVNSTSTGTLDPSSVVYEVNWSPSYRAWARPFYSFVNADDPHGIWVLGPFSFCYGEHFLRRDTLDQRPTRQRHRVYHSIRRNGVHDGHER
jgi:hypothetical protein